MPFSEEDVNKAVTAVNSSVAGLVRNVAVLGTVGGKVLSVEIDIHCSANFFFDKLPTIDVVRGVQHCLSHLSKVETITDRQLHLFLLPKTALLRHLTGPMLDRRMKYEQTDMGQGS